MANLTGRQIDHIRNMLTFRYDPNEKPFIKHTKMTDWVPTMIEPDPKLIEEMMKAQLQKLEGLDKIGIALSSGIDSVLAMYMIREMYPNKSLVAIHYNGINDELIDAHNHAQNCNAEFVEIKDASILDKLQWTVTIMKDFHWDAFDYIVYDTAHSVDCDILVTGDGADELFAGYTFRYNGFRPGNDNPSSKFYAYMDTHQRDWVEDQCHLFGPEISFEWDKMREYVMPYFTNQLPTLCQIFMADYNGKLAHLFMKKATKFSTVFQIQTLSPYLFDPLIKYATHIEPNYKLYGNVGKIPIREVGARRRLAATVKKIGFSHDVISEWNGPRWKKAQNDISDPENQIFSRGLISHEWVMRHSLNEDRFDVRYVNKFMQLLALEQWLRAYQ